MTCVLRFLSILTLLLHLAACGQQTSDRLPPEDLAFHNQAVGLMGQFNYEEALTRLSDLAQRYPDNPDLRVDLAIAVLNRQLEGDEDTALDILAKVLRQAPQHLRQGGHAAPSRGLGMSYLLALLLATATSLPYRAPVGEACVNSMRCSKGLLLIMMISPSGPMKYPWASEPHVTRSSM